MTRGTPHQVEPRHSVQMKVSMRLVPQSRASKPVCREISQPEDEFVEPILQIGGPKNKFLLVIFQSLGLVCRCQRRLGTTAVE